VRTVAPRRIPGISAALLGSHSGGASCRASTQPGPGLGRLLAACLPGGEAAAFELRKMAVALLSLEARRDAARGRLIWLLPPKMLRAAR